MEDRDKLLLQVVEGMKHIFYQPSQANNDHESEAMDNLVDDVDRLVSCLTMKVDKTFNLVLSSASSRSCKYVLNKLMQAHRELAREAIHKCLVLWKNGKMHRKPLLPLDKNAPKILVVGSDADILGYWCGGWTISLEGGSGATTTGFQEGGSGSMGICQ